MKYLLYILTSVLLLGLISLYAIQKNISNNLKVEKKVVEKAWLDFNEKLQERDMLFESQSKNNTDSLSILLLKSKSERTNKNNSMEIVFKEYQLNEYITRNLLKTNKKIGPLNWQLNVLKNKYNATVKDYNIYFTVFPNFFVAKKMGLKKANYFEIMYGSENRNPILVANELPEWANNVDTIL